MSVSLEEWGMLGVIGWIDGNILEGMLEKDSVAGGYSYFDKDRRTVFA